MCIYMYVRIYVYVYIMGLKKTPYRFKEQTCFFLRGSKAQCF